MRLLWLNKDTMSDSSFFLPFFFNRLTPQKNILWNIAISGTPSLIWGLKKDQQAFKGNLNNLV